MEIGAKELTTSACQSPLKRLVLLARRQVIGERPSIVRPQSVQNGVAGRADAMRMLQQIDAHLR
jgi:hypothetical protein